MAFKYLVVYLWVHNHPEEAAVPLRRTRELKFIERMINWKWLSHKKREMLFRGCVNESIGCCRQKKGLYSTSITNLLRINLGIKCVIFFEQRGQIVTSEGEIKEKSTKYGKWMMWNPECLVPRRNRAEGWPDTKHCRELFCVCWELSKSCENGRISQ